MVMNTECIEQYAGRQQNSQVQVNFVSYHWYYSLFYLFIDTSIRIVFVIVLLGVNNLLYYYRHENFL